nr:serine hydrolase domain-containing protein [Sphingomonas colocasiae]
MLVALAGLAALGGSQALLSQTGPAPAATPASAPPAAQTAAVDALRPTPKLAPGQPIPAGELEALVDGIVRQSMSDNHIAGVTVSIVQNDKPVLLKGYGISNINPMRPVDPRKTLFRIGSVSKTMTWILIMREVEKGTIKLTDPVNKYLPPESQIPDQGFKNPIRIVDLMAHAPGMEDSALGHLILDKPERLTPPADYLRLHRPNRVREAGTLSTYSNYGVAVAGQILARLNKVDFETLADRDVFAPAGMSRSTFREPMKPRAGFAAPMPAALAGDVSDGFRWGGNRFKSMGPDFVGSVASAGSITTTAEDMARYMRLLLRDGSIDGTTVYGPVAAKAFRTPIMKVPAGVNGWAHGFGMSTQPGGFTGYGHGGGTSAFLTQMTVIPELDLGVFISTNTVGGNVLSSKLPGAIIERFYAQTPPIQRPGNPALLKSAGNYEGTYVATRRSYSGLEKFLGVLGGTAKVSASPDGYLVTSGALGSQSWAPGDSPTQFRAMDGEGYLNFVLDGNGKAIRIYTPSGANAFERASGLFDLGLFGWVGGLAALIAFGLWTAYLARRGTTYQGSALRLSHYGLLGAGLSWIVAVIAIATWLPSIMANGPSLHYWPPTPLVVASTAALIATLATIASVLLLGVGLRKAPRPGNFALLRHVAVALLFLALSVMVGIRGGLLPWA